MCKHKKKGSRAPLEGAAFGRSSGFDNLTEQLLNNTDLIPFMWKRIIDWSSKVMIFCQVDRCGSWPKISKCSVPCGQESGLLAPAVLLDDQTLSSSDMHDVIGHWYVASVGNLMRLLEYAEDRLKSGLTQEIEMDPENDEGLA